MEFIDKRNESVEQLNKIINRINDFVDKDDPTKNYKERLTLLLLACHTIEEGGVLYRGYIQKNHFFNPNEVIPYDYTLSYFADRCYIAIKNMIKCYMAYRNDERMLGVEKEKVELLAKYRNQMLYISSRWHTERFIEVWDLDKSETKKKLPRRLPLLKDVTFCFDRVLAVKMGIKFKDNFMPKKLVVCVPPSAGKTYSANAYTSLMLSHHQIYFRETGLIRMTNTADNAINYGSQVYKMMVDKQFMNIFPEFSKYYDGKKQKMFTYESKEKYLLKDCAPECTDSMFMFGVEASINGKRAPLGSVMDDLSGGVDDMDNDELHRKITDKIMSDVLDRSDDDDSPVVIMGTMYNENDTQNAFINAWTLKGLVPLEGHKNIRMTKDGTCAVCLVDVEDEMGNSIAPLLYTNEKLEEKRTYFRNRGKGYVYNLIYRQKRDSREPKTFAYEVLPYQYDNVPESLINGFTKCFIDTTRTSGNDYFSQPFLTFNEEDGKWWFVDCLFEQKSLGMDSDPHNEFRDKVCKKIIQMNTIDACIESNTSNTTSLVLKDRCKELGYNACKFKNHYTTKKGRSSSKIVRILNMEETIKNNIVFPSPKAKISTSMYLFMQQLTQWNSKAGQVKTNPDDAADSLAMFCEEYIYQKKNIGSIGKAFSLNEMFGGL